MERRRRIAARRGLSLASSGTISGTPTATGTTTFTSQVQDSTGATANGSLSISIAPTVGGAVPVITVATLPTGTLGQPYNATIGVDGGTAPYSCAVTAGTLPSGLTLGNNCVVSGTPTSVDTSAVTEADANLAATNYPNAAFSGTYTAPGGNGRVQLTLANADLPAATYRQTMPRTSSMVAASC